ncbi:MAG: CHAD domain-containing protein [Rhodospirillales bacterium]|nr:MAG: CHAD domain-containing protein [Rhodospirillales bacterium]
MATDAAAGSSEPDDTGTSTPSPTWKKARRLKLRPDATAEDALAAAVDNALDHWGANEACVIARAHEEGVHQMRVATRRLRSRLALYKSVLPEAEVARLQGELKWLIAGLGPARDWDVFLGETWRPVAEALPDEADLALLGNEAEKRRDRGYRKAAATLGSRRYRNLRRQLATWVADRPWRKPGGDHDDGAASALQQPARRFASTVIEHRHQSVLALGQSLADMDPETRHKLRIKIKKLRYAVEFFRSLYSNNAVNPYVSALTTLQDALGTMNDLEVARELMHGLAEQCGGRKRARLAFAGGLVVGWHLPRVQAVSPLNGSWDSFTQRQPFWDPSDD